MSTLFRFAFLCLALIVGISNSYRSYDGYKIFGVTLKSNADHGKIVDLESEDFLEVISESRSNLLEVLISPKNLARCQQVFRSQNLLVEVINHNVGAHVRKERSALHAAPAVAAGNFSYDNYHRLDDFYDHLDTLAELHKDNAETFNLSGTTYEGRKVQAIRISSNVTSEEAKQRPMIWIDGGIHAREWISPATVMYIIDSLLGEQEADRSAKMEELLGKYQFVIAPCINPDGYEYTHTTERLWRKNRQPSGCKDKKANWFGGCFYRSCYGADLNRNWSPDFGKEGVSKDPCHRFYPGAKPFDQESVNMVKTYLEENRSKVKGYISFHSYGRLFLFPLAYTAEAPPDRDHHVKVGAAVVAAIKDVHNQTYSATTWDEALYLASGVSADWAYLKLNVTDSYTIELRDRGPYGFVLPKEQILETGQEIVPGVIALIENIKQD